ncbi:nucleotide exchange factor GrpE [Spirillospora sp. NPDC047279]|uniref:nucleotide exchange factor GrpE n=1 Tax=Spirillospora sp. NPDC047279 TaxID=3155478 RepID=UPI0033C287A1
MSSAGDESVSQDEIADALAGLSERLERLERLERELVRGHERAVHRESVIDRLHEENQRLRRGELQATLEPLRTALYRLHDLARNGAGRWSAPDPPRPADAAALLTAVADEVADALARTGVERFTVEPGEPYDAARHRPVAVEPVTDPALAGTVVAVRTDGFEHDGRVVRKAEVSVGKALPEEPPEQPPGEPVGQAANGAAGPESGVESAKSGTAPSTTGSGTTEPLREAEAERDDERGPSEHGLR